MAILRYHYFFTKIKILDILHQLIKRLKHQSNANSLNSSDLSYQYPDILPESIKNEKKSDFLVNAKLIS